MTKMHNPDKCSMLDCDKPLGPEALTFEHDGKPAGGICGVCVENAAKLRVLFVKGEGGVYYPEEMVALG